VIGSDVQLWWWNRDSRDTHTWGDLSNMAQLALWRNLSNGVGNWQDGSESTIRSLGTAGPPEPHVHCPVGQWRQLLPYHAMPRWPRAGAISTPSALVINGDATAFGFDAEWNRFRDLYDTDSSNPYRQTFVGLGNHDVQNNILDCTDGGVDATTCTRRSVDILRQSVAGVTIDGATSTFAHLQGPLSKPLSSRVNAFDWGSAAYSWDEGSYHFILMNNYP
jgi:hypothetical protein